MNGGAYGTNQFSSMDIRTSEPRNTSQDQDFAKASSKIKQRREDESDNERLEDDDTNSEDGRTGGGKAGRGHNGGQRRGGKPGDLSQAQAEYA